MPRAYRPRPRRSVSTTRRPRATYPLECDEQATYNAYLDAQGWPWTEHYAVPNAGRRGWKAQRQAKLEGIQKGVPDTCLAVSAEAPGAIISTTAFRVPRTYHSLYVEFKRQRLAYGKTATSWANQISDEQADWIMRLRKLGHAAVVAFGADEGIAIFELYRRGQLVLPAGLYFEDPALLSRRQ